jgi:glycine hydroxymethyltransferase
MRRIAGWMDDVIEHVKDEEALDRIGAEVAEFCRGYPAPGMSVM